MYVGYSYVIFFIIVYLDLVFNINLNDEVTFEECQNGQISLLILNFFHFFFPLIFRTILKINGLDISYCLYYIIEKYMHRRIGLLLIRYI